MQKQRVLVVAILAITCIAVAITFILVGTTGPRRVAASAEIPSIPINEQSAQVTSTLPMFRRLDAN